MEDIVSLSERAKELQCLYAIDGVLSDRQQNPGQAFERIVEVIPSGWQAPAATGACIEYLGRRFVGPGFEADASTMNRPIHLMEVAVGSVTVSDASDAARAGTSSFLDEEDELLRRICGRISEFLEWKHSEMLGAQTPRTRNHWAWRQRFAEALADAIDANRFGVARVFLGGSTARGDAGPGSDIDLYVQCTGSSDQRHDLGLWIEGWSQCLAHVALEQTGQPFPEGILNVQWLTEEPDFRQRAEFQELKVGS